jgi:Na+/H+-translocating membrane pyrophosphatase
MSDNIILFIIIFSVHLIVTAILSLFFYTTLQDTAINFLLSTGMWFVVMVPIFFIFIRIKAKKENKSDVCNKIS